MATTGGFLGSMNEWLKKPENQLLLAGAGQKLDPSGVGGALGGATGAYLQSNIAADRAKQVEDARKHQQLVLQYTLENMRDQNNPNANLLTPKGQPGPTSVSANNDGSVKITADLPGGPGSTANQLATQQAAPATANTGTTPVNTPSPAVSPAGAALLGNEANPLPIQGTTVVANREPVVAAPNTTPADPYARTTRPFDIRSVIPFS